MKTPPLFKDIYQFNVLMLNTTKAIPKDYKFSLGERIKNYSMDALEMIHELVNEPGSRLEGIANLLNKIQNIRLLIRLCVDTKCINVEKFAFINAEIERILKQLYAWQKAQHKKSKTSEGQSTA